MKSNVIEYKFRGELDVDLLAKNMRKDKTPFVITIWEDDGSAFLFISKKYQDNYKGENLPVFQGDFNHVGHPLDWYKDRLGKLYRKPDKTG